MSNTKYYFNLEDTIVFEGAITKWGIIGPLIEFNYINFDVRYASKEEIKRYEERP